MKLSFSLYRASRERTRLTAKEPKHALEIAVSPAIQNVWSAALLQAKNEDRVKVYANVSGLSGVIDSGHAMEMRCALVLITFPASEGVFRISGFKSAGSTVVPSHLSPADLAKTNVISVSRRCWPAIVGIAHAISKPGFFPRRQLQAIGVRRARHRSPTAEADRVLLW